MRLCNHPSHLCDSNKCISTVFYRFLMPGTTGIPFALVADYVIFAVQTIHPYEKEKTMKPKLILLSTLFLIRILVAEPLNDTLSTDTLVTHHTASNAKLSEPVSGTLRYLFTMGMVFLGGVWLL